MKGLVGLVFITLLLPLFILDNLMVSIKSTRIYKKQPYRSVLIVLLYIWVIPEILIINTLSSLVENNH
jgi:hypothetical protein